jgi:hypothetical protein
MRCPEHQRCVTSNIPPGAWICVCCECCVLSGTGVCDGLITCPEESYRVWCVSECYQVQLYTEDNNHIHGEKQYTKQYTITEHKTQNNTQTQNIKQYTNTEHKTIHKHRTQNNTQTQNTKQYTNTEHAKWQAKHTEGESKCKTSN